MEVRRRTINQALTRPETVAGAEKLPVGIVATVGVLLGALAWVLLSLPAAAASAACFLGGLPLLQRLAKADPRLVAVYLANLRLRRAYPARTPAHVPEPDLQRRATPGTAPAVVGLLLVALGWLLASRVLLGLGGIGLFAAAVLRVLARRTGV